MSNIREGWSKPFCMPPPLPPSLSRSVALYTIQCLLTSDRSIDFVITFFPTTGQGQSRAADGSEYDGGWKNDVYHGQGTLKQKGKLPWTYTGAWVNGKRDGKGELAFAASGGPTFVGTFEGGRPIAGGQFKWSDGTKDKFELDPRFEPYLGRGSEEKLWEITLSKMMQHQKQKLDGGDDEDTEFGFGELGIDGEDEVEQEPLAEGEIWVEEEVEVDEFGNPIEETARIVTDIAAVAGDSGNDGVHSF